ncbi:MAG: RNA polymerase sigma factor RpoH [Gammaproteobacteria bacterium]|nr:RNA polymerase sigma factor RpoH [Gammaproteobacteria bacterium]MYD77025.1 RNA polymerase sigma factor RpoH [Gammaproteobacteria bacterium]MYJ53046.1 RNA polymerase sigma factor RpoH [Gammaproteobacteria bacterium]
MTQSLSTPADLVASDNLSGYLRAVHAAPVLTAEQEYDLATRYRNEGDIDAARELVVSHLRHVVKVARGFMGYGLPLADLIQEGSIGLMKAVKRFDPNRDVRLVSFAIHWIRAEIYDYVLKNWRLVKVATTKAQRKLFFNLRKSRAKLGWMNEDEVQDLATSLDVDAETVREMESRMSGTDVAFDALADPDPDKPYLAPSQHLGDMRYNPEAVLIQHEHETESHDQLIQALEQLDERSKDIVVRRWLSDDKPTLHDLAAEYSISAERIRQIEKRAMEKMKRVIAVQP